MSLTLADCSASTRIPAGVALEDAAGVELHEYTHVAESDALHSSLGGDGGTGPGKVWNTGTDDVEVGLALILVGFAEVGMIEEVDTVEGGVDLVGEVAMRDEVTGFM